MKQKTTRGLGDKATWRLLLALLVTLSPSLLVPPAHAAEILVATPAQITAAAATAEPGDTLLMADGEWADADILFKATGSAGLPITLRAQTLGRVTLTGQSRLRMAGNYLVVNGLTFTNGYRTSGEVISFQESSSSVANHSRLINCAVVDYNPPDFNNDTKWVGLYGLSNHVEHCYLRGKTNVGTTLLVTVSDLATEPNYHVIAHNYFGLRPVLGQNGGETIRIGASDVSFNLSRTRVEDNYFERCNGDAEIISSKSFENVFRRNTFYECEGALSLRHGNGSVVEGNYFFGNRKPLTGGVRLVGENHKVVNNYFQELTGTSSRSPLAIMQGLENSPLNGYFQVKNALVVFNTFVNCTNSIMVGLVGTLSGTSQQTTLPPTNCVIANNIVLQPAGKIIDQRTNGLNFTWESNIMFGATLGVTTSNGMFRIDPRLELAADGLWRPASNSPALNNAGGTFSEVTQDFEGHARPAVKDIGCDQASLDARIYPQLTAANVGPVFMRVSGTVLTWANPADITYGTPLGLAQLNASANAAGTMVYDPPFDTLLQAGSNQTLTVVFTPVDLVNFTAATQFVTINVRKATPVITWASPAPIVHGVSLSATQLNAAANLVGTFVYHPPLGALLEAGQGQTLSVTFVPVDRTNFSLATKSVSINVAKATPALTWLAPTSIEQGTLLSAAQLNATANVPGTFVYTPDIGTVLAAGSGQALSVQFTPDEANNYLSASRTVTINVTIGGKTLPTISWPAPAPVLFGTPLGALQLNASASAPGTLSYAPPAGTVLPLGNHLLTVNFSPTDAATYTTASKTVPFSVAPISNTLVRVAYIVPSNRVPQAHAVPTLRSLMVSYQEFFAQQMEHNGFGRKSFAFETAAAAGAPGEAPVPLIHVLSVPQTDSFLRNDIYGNRVLDAARTAGLTIGAPGQIWWLIAETHVQQSDGSISGGFEVGLRTNTPNVSSGWAISGGDRLALFQSIYQTNSLLYDGATVPGLGPFTLVQDVSFPWFEGITLSGLSSSAVGSGLRSLGSALGLADDFRNDENFNGNLMGFGYRGIRGVLHPERYIFNYCSLSYASALALSVSPYFNPGRLGTDLNLPGVAVTTSGTRAPSGGLLSISFNASDDQALHAAWLSWESASDFIVVDEMRLEGMSASGTFAVPYYNPAQANRYRVTVFDHHGNARAAETTILPTVPVNRAPLPFIRVSPAIAGLGEDVLLDASDTFDTEHGVGLLEVEWDLDGDGLFDTLPGNGLWHIANFPSLGPRLIRARITDPAGDTVISAPVAVNIVPCKTGLSPVSRSHGHGGGTNKVEVTAAGKCRWVPFTTNEWIQILHGSMLAAPAPEIFSPCVEVDAGSPTGPRVEGPDFVGSLYLNYYVQPNPFFTERRGFIFIGDKVYTVIQQPTVCATSFSPTNKFHGYGSTVGTITMKNKEGCHWVVGNTNAWVTITAGGSGSGTGVVNYVLTENRVPGRRTGYITINEKVFTVTQWGLECEWALSPVGRSHSENAESGSVTISTANRSSDYCAWTIQNINDWITITSATSGTTSSNFTYTLAPNLTGAPRVGVVTVNSETFTVIQQACSFAITPASGTHLYLAQTSSICVVAGPLCNWSVSNTNAWVSVASALNGAGPNRVDYVLAENPTGNARSGYINVAGVEYFIVQDGKPCAYNVPQPEGSGLGVHGEGGGFEDVEVRADVGCDWIAESPVPWISIVANASGSGSNYVTYTVEPNFGPARSAALIIANQDYIVYQASGVRDIALSDMTLGSGQTNSIFLTLNAHGGENRLAFSLCFDPNLLAFASANLLPSAPLSATLAVSNGAPGRVGLVVAMPPGHSMPPGTGTVVEVSFAALSVNGKPTTTISVCESPAPALVDAIGQPLTAIFDVSTVHVIGICTLAESLDATNLNFTVGPDMSGWACNTAVTHDLEDAAASGVTPDNGESFMETTVAGPGLISFWWKVSSEPNNDRLRFYVDGSEQYRISGEIDWEFRTFNVPAGSHVLRWRYNKNATLVQGQDMAWVDQILFDAAPPAITTQPVSRSVDAGANVSFSVVASGQPPLTYQWRYHHIPLADGPDISGATTATLTLSNVQPSQAGSYSVVVGTPEGSINSASAILTVTPILPLAEGIDVDGAGGAPALPITTSGNAPWVGQAAVNHDGADAGRSGTITHSQTTSFQTIINGPGTIRFWWKVSSELNNDRLTFYINGSSQGNISGEPADWVQRTFTLGNGPQTLLWTYSKSSSTTSGQDRGWVDEFQFTPTPVTITTHPANLIVDQGSNATMTVAVSGTPPIAYQWSCNGAPLPNATNAALTIANVQPANAGNYSVFVSNAGGSAASSNATLQVNLLVPLAQALDTTNLTWTTSSSPSGAAPWVGQVAISRDGSDAARAGNIGDNTTTTMQATIAGPGTLYFWWKVSSQSNNSDRLRFYLGGSEQESISGEVDWTFRTWTIPSGANQTIDWRYQKNASAKAGQDMAWVDQVRYVPNNTPTAPFIAVQPVNKTIVAPATVSFHALAGGSTPLAYQWFFNGNPLTNGNGVAGAATTNLTLTGAGAAQAGIYSVLVTNAAGSALSSLATLAAITAPIITNPPASQHVIAGANAIFTVGAMGQAPLTYQWRCHGTNLINSAKFSGVNTATLTINGAQPAQEGTYSVTVSNAAGVASSLQGAGQLTTWTAARSALVLDNQQTSLESTVTGPGTIQFAWKVSSQTNADAFIFDIGGSEQARISGEEDWHQKTFPVPAGTQTLRWRYAKDASGSAGLDAGHLDHVSFTPDGAPVAPTIAVQPTSRTVGAGATTILDATVTGSTPLTYQWRLNGTPLQNSAAIAGAQTPRLTLSGVQLAQAGNYSLLVSNAAGTVISSNALLAMTNPPAGNAPVVAVPPASRSTGENATVTFTANVTGATPLIYQWWFQAAAGQGDLGTGGQGESPLVPLSPSPQVSGVTTASLTISNVQLAHAGTYTLVASNAVGRATAHAALTITTLGEAAGAPYVSFSQAGNASWLVQSTDTHDGISAVRSGVIADGQNSRLETYVEGPGTVTFWWKVSCEASDDNLRFYVGANEMIRISGEVGWQQQTWAVPAGNQLLKWRYGKGADTAAGQDAGWVDDIVYTPSTINVAPTVTNQPVSRTVFAGHAVAFHASVSGSLPITFQWLSNGLPVLNGNGVSGARTPNLMIASAPAQSTAYTLFASNAAGTTSSGAATLNATSVLAAPLISSQPVNQSVSEGASASFTVAASGASPLFYQWQLNGVPLVDGIGVNGATTPTLSLSDVHAAQIGSYSVVVSNAAGVAISSPAGLMVLTLSEVVGAPYLDFIPNGGAWLVQTGQTYTAGATNGGAALIVSTPPGITSQPAGQTVIAGNSVSFSVVSTGSPPLSVQWRLNGNPLADGNGVSGVNTPTLMLADVQASDAGNYSVIVSNGVGTITSSNAVLIVLVPPGISAQPVSATVPESASANFTVAATGTAPLTYQWKRNGSNIVNGGSVSGANSATLTLNNAQPAQGGFYSVLISNPAGIVLSTEAQLTVQAALTVGECLNAPYLNWDTFLSSPWVVQTNVTHDGEAAAQSGNIGHDGATWIETTVVGPGSIRFWWKVSSQTNADFLTFSVNGSTWAEISGAVDWQRMTFTVPGGEVTLRWTYSKDSAATNGLDRGWLDEVDYVPTVGPSVPVIVQEPQGMDLDPGDTASLSVVALGTAPLSYQWRFEGQDLSDGGNVLGSKAPTLTISAIQLAQAGAYDVVVRNPYSLDVSEQVFLNVTPVIPLSVAVDTDHTNLLWQTGGSSAWRGQTNFNNDRIDSAQSGVLNHNQTNWIQTIVDGPGAISFFWKSSSQTNSDRMRFTIDGAEAANISGETDWRQRTFAINYPGTVLRWHYTKDGSGSAGLDRAWLDQVVFGPTAPIITNTSQEINIIDVGTTVRLNVDASGSKPFSYQWTHDGTNLVNSPTNVPVFPGYLVGATGNHRLTISNAQPWQSGIYIGEVHNAAGVAISPPFTVEVVPSLPLGLALNTNLIWETEGYTWWVASTNIHRDGLAARNGGPLPNSDATTLRTHVDGPGTLSFWWRASTETNIDVLTFEMDGNVLATISGNHNWQQKTYDLGAGNFELEWTYNKSGLFTNNMDQVFVDQVVFAPIAPIITNQPVSQTVDQGATVTLTAGIRGTPPLNYQWYHGGIPLVNGGNVTGANSATLRITGIQLAQAGTYSLFVGNAVGSVDSADATITVLPSYSIPEALDHYDYTWTTTGSPAWIGQGITTHDGLDAARSPVVADGASASMQATIAGPGTINFWWKVSSQTNSDVLIFYVGGTEQARISGTVDWQLRSFSIPAGNQQIRWNYSKNGSGVAGQDRGWVDQLVFIPTPPSIASHPASTNVDQGTTATFSVVATGTPPFTYQWKFDGVDIPGAFGSTLTLNDVQTWQEGNYSVVVANTAGTANSLNAALSVNVIVPLAEALDGSNLVWVTSVTGNAPAWVGQSAVSHDGVDGARIANVPHSGSSSFQTTLLGPGSLGFWWKVSSQTNSDTLIFYTNNVEAARISGEVNWQLRTINLGAGSQTLKWTYAKNGSTSTGQDRAWVDQVTFGAVPPIITTQPANQGVDEGANASFSVAVGGTPPFSFQWQLNGSDIVNGSDIIGATSSNLILNGVQLSQAGTYRVLISGQGGTAISTGATLAVYPVLALDEALDTPGLTWTTNGAPPWIGHGAVTHDGTDAARSGAITHNGNTSMSTVFSGPGAVSFWWKVSSQTNSDYLTLYTNGVLAVRISGEVPWSFRSVNIGSGAQTLTWTYSKNGSTSTGQDRAWLDQVSFGLVAPTIITQPSNVVTSSGSDVTFTVVAAATPPIYYRWMFNGSPLSDGPGISGSASASLDVSSVGAQHIGNYSVFISNSVDSVTSANASLTLSTNVSIDQALDGGLTYTTGGTGQPWKGQTGVSRDSHDAAQTGAVGDSTYTWIKTTVTGPGPLSFWWKVSSEQDHDYLRFMMDAADQVRISGEQDWQQVNFNVPSGTHELQWRYSKNASLAAGQDRGWVDYVYFGSNAPPIVIVTTAPPSILIQPVSKTVDASDAVSLRVSAAGTAPMSYRWWRDGTNLVVNGPDIGGAMTEELTIHDVRESHAGNYTVVISNSAGFATSVPARLTVLPIVDLAEAVDSFDLFFSTTGNAPWVGHTVITHDGVDAARSGLLLDGESTILETMVMGPGMLSFWWKVSSETNADYLEFFINSAPQESISGEVNWQLRSYHLPPGPQILEWAYYKDAFGSTNADRGWLDQVSFVPDGNPPPTNQPVSVRPVQLNIAGNIVTLTWDADPAKTYKVFYKEQLADAEWTLLDGEILVTQKVVDGEIVPNVVVATTTDGFAGPTRFYKVMEYVSPP